MSTNYIFDLFAIINNDSYMNDSQIKVTNCFSSKDLGFGSKHKILNYNKELLGKDPQSVGTLGLARSVVIESQTNQIVSFAPPKSYDFNTFSEQFPNNSDNNLVVEEFVEGTMINIFFDKVIQSWQIATRRTVGGHVSFYKLQKGATFNQMFSDACKENKLDVTTLDTQFVYSFVLQHPENRIVLPIKKPQLYLVAVYYINNETFQVTPISMDDVKSSGVFSKTTVKFPEEYAFTSYEDLLGQFSSNKVPFNVMGLVIRHRLYNIRTKIRNPVYEEIRQLKGNQPKLQYQYLLLRQQGKVSDFLKFYPENKKDFTKFRDQIHQFTDSLYMNYVSCYIKKEGPLANYPAQYKTHMFNIHQLFLSDLKEKGEYVSHAVVINYVNSLHPSKLMYSLNFNKHIKQDDNMEA